MTVYVFEWPLLQNQYLDVVRGVSTGTFFCVDGSVAGLTEQVVGRA